MKKSSVVLVALLLTASFTQPILGDELVDPDKWKQFSQNLVEALKSDHQGLQASAMRLIVQYGDQVDVKEAVYDVMRIYREHDDPQMQRLAVVTLGRMNSPWAIGFLERLADFEESDVLEATMRDVVADYKLKAN